MITMLFWVAVGLVIGLFIPGPFNETIKAGLKAAWHKLFLKIEEEVEELKE